MSVSPEQLEELMRDVEKEDPIDFADLPFDDDALRKLVANHLCEMAASMENFSEEDRHLTLLAVSAKLVLENLVLHVQLLRLHDIAPSENVQAMLDQLRRRPSP